MTLVLHLYELHVCFPLISSTLVCVIGGVLCMPLKQSTLKPKAYVAKHVLSLLVLCFGNYDSRALNEQTKTDAYPLPTTGEN
jgi:hypothetical protein